MREEKSAYWRAGEAARRHCRRKKGFGAIGAMGWQFLSKAFWSAAFTAGREQFFPCFAARLVEEPVRFGAAFHCPRLDAVRAVAHLVAGNHRELHRGQLSRRAGESLGKPVP